MMRNGQTTEAQRHRVKTLPISSLCLCASVVALSSCVIRPGHIAAEKVTVLGFELSPSSATGYPAVRLGLVRHFFQQVPVSTNRLYAPAYSASMNASLAPLSQTAREDFATGAAASPPTNSLTH